VVLQGGKSSTGGLISASYADVKLTLVLSLLEMDKLRMWAHVNLSRFNKAKGRVLHWGRDKSQYQYKLWGERIDSSPAEKNLWVLMDEKLDMS